MAAVVQTFTANALPAGFGKEGTVRFPKKFKWSNRDAANGTNVAPGAIVLPQTSDRFCLIDGPDNNGAGSRTMAGVDMFPPAGAGHYVNHGDGTYTRAVVGSTLHWGNVVIPPGGKLQFHWIFLRGQQSGQFNAFAQFRAVEPNGSEALRRTFAQSMDPGGGESGAFYRWRAHELIEFPQGFGGTLQWIVAQGERVGGPNAPVNANARLHPAGLALDFISIIT